MTPPDSVGPGAPGLVPGSAAGRCAETMPGLVGTPLGCVLLAEHAGMHHDETGAHWTSPTSAALCPQGRTDYEACFAPFRYCPVKGCGRMEQALEPTPEAIQALVDVAPPVSEYALRVKHAVEQIDHALTDSRIDGAAAAWLRTIRSGLTGGEDDA